MLCRSLTISLFNLLLFFAPCLLQDTVQILGVTTQYLDAQGGTYTADAEDRILAVDE
jgi:hypothetical protein